MRRKLRCRLADFGYSFRTRLAGIIGDVYRQRLPASTRIIMRHQCSAMPKLQSF